MKNVYKYYSSLTPASGVIPCMGSNNLTEIAFNCPGLVDRQNLNLATVDLQFVSINAAFCQMPGLRIIPPLNPDKFLIRY